MLRLLVWSLIFLDQVSTEKTVSLWLRSLCAQMFDCKFMLGKRLKPEESDRDRERQKERVDFLLLLNNKVWQLGGYSQSPGSLKPCWENSHSFSNITPVHCVLFPQLFHKTEWVPKKLQQSAYILQNFLFQTWNFSSSHCIVQFLQWMSCYSDLSVIFSHLNPAVTKLIMAISLTLIWIYKSLLDDLQKCLFFSVVFIWFGEGKDAFLLCPHHFRSLNKMTARKLSSGPTFVSKPIFSFIHFYLRA